MKLMLNGVEVGPDGQPLVKAEAGQGSGEVDTLRQELAQAQYKLGNQAETIERGMAENKRLIREAGASNDNSFRLKAELDKAQQELASEKGKMAEERTGGLAQIETLKAERNTLTSQLTDALARPVLPTNARERLIAVNGINAALADKALDALKTDPGQ